MSIEFTHTGVVEGQADERSMPDGYRANNTLVRTITGGTSQHSANCLAEVHTIPPQLASLPASGSNHLRA